MVTSIFDHTGSRYLIDGLTLLNSPGISKDARPKIDNTPTTLIFVRL